MKTVFVLLISLSLSGAVSAQNALFEVPNVSVVVNLYSGNPDGGGTLLESQRVNNSPFGVSLGDVSAHDFVTLEHQGDVFTFTTFPGGIHKDNIYINTGGVEEGDAAYEEAQEDALSLGDLVDALAQDPGVLQELGN